MRYKEYEKLMKSYLGLTMYDEDIDVKIVRRLVNKLINSLYRLSKKRVLTIDRRKIKQAGITFPAAVNWVDLQCVEVSKVKDLKIGKVVYNVLVEEADCKELEEYIDKWMHCWGWNTKTRTEW